MKYKEQARRNAEIDVTSFSDIAFLLIIFFIVTSTFVQSFGHRLSIPSGSADSSKKEDKLLSVSMKEQKIFFGEKADQITLEDLRRRLKEADLPNRAENKRLVIVECAKDVPYEQYFKVVMAIAEAGGVLTLLEDENAGKGQKL